MPLLFSAETDLSPSEDGPPLLRYKQVIMTDHCLSLWLIITTEDTNPPSDQEPEYAGMLTSGAKQRRPAELHPCRKHLLKNAEINFGKTCR